MELEKDYIIRLISPQDKIKGFKTGDATFQPLKTFLQNQAVDFQTALVAQTYVAILLNEEAKDTGKIIGFITLTCSEVDLRNGYTIDDCPHANKYDSLPAVKIARLAVDSRYRRKGIGETLVSLAVTIAIEIIAPQIGCRFLITDSKLQSITFYERNGFIFLNTACNRIKDNPVMFMDLLM
ncbi:MAG: GNAT family N-acetyltransferase [Methylococcaceae bacterium]